MNSRRLYISFLFLMTASLCNNTLAQQSIDYVRRDITHRLQYSTQEKSKKVSTLNLISEDRNTTLQITSDHPFSVFSGEMMLASEVLNLKWTMDSLDQSLGFPIHLTFFSKHSSPIILTQITQLVQDPLEPQLRKGDDQMNFAIITGSILLLFLSIMPGILLEAISGIGKLFSINKREDRTEELRSNSASAILLGFFIVVFSSVLSTFLSASDLSETESLFYAGLLNFFIFLIVIVLRYLITFLFSWIFGLTQVFDHQMNSFFRITLVLCLLVFSAMLIDFMSVNRLNFSVLTLNYLIPVLLVGYYLTLFLRLQQSTALRPLHLFSYLCVSEFIPFVLLVYTI